MSNNLTWHDHRVTKSQRASQKFQTPCVLWFTGLSGAGKSTVANMVEQQLFQAGYHCFLLDGDNMRHGLNKDLSFSDADRVENIRRAGEVSKLFADSGLIVLSAFISPFRSDRRMVRQLFPEQEFVEVFIDAPLEVCEERDPKGLYVKARQGLIPNFTGIDSDYEKPEKPEIHLRTDLHTPEQCMQQVMSYLAENGILKDIRPDQIPVTRKEAFVSNDQN